MKINKKKSNGSPDESEPEDYANSYIIINKPKNHKQTLNEKNKF